MNSAKLELLAKEYELDMEILFECLAQACRTLYGVVEIDSFHETKFFAFELDVENKIVQKEMRLTKEGIKRIIKETSRNIMKIKAEEEKASRTVSYTNAINLLAFDISSISKEEVFLKTISVREMNEKEKTKYKANYYAVVRASRYLVDAEKEYFYERTKNLKKGVIFVLD